MDAVSALPLTLRPNRVKTALGVLLCLVFTTIGVFMVRDGDPIGYFVGAMFALGTPVFALQFHPQAAYLHLTEEGFTYCSLFRAHTVHWNVVEEFAVVTLTMSGVGRRRPMVTWNFVPNYPRTGWARAISQTLSGYEAALPDTYGLTHAELAGLMNMLLRRYGGSRSFHLDPP